MLGWSDSVQGVLRDGESRRVQNWLNEAWVQCRNSYLSADSHNQGSVFSLPSYKITGSCGWKTVQKWKTSGSVTAYLCLFTSSFITLHCSRLSAVWLRSCSAMVLSHNQYVDAITSCFICWHCSLRSISGSGHGSSPICSLSILNTVTCSHQYNLCNFGSYTLTLHTPLNHVFLLYI